MLLSKFYYNICIGKHCNLCMFYVI